MASPYRDSNNDGDDGRARGRPLLVDLDDGDDTTAAFGNAWNDAPQTEARHDIPEASIPDSEDMQIRNISPEPLDSPLTRSSSIPVWLREAAPSFRWGWLPVPVRHTARRVASWTAGPQPPQIQRITPVFATIQEFPLRLVDRFLPKWRHKAGALVVLYAAWALTIGLVLHLSASSGDIAGYGTPADLWCGASLWSGAKTCGLDGNNCRPFGNASMAFRCRASCASVILQQEYSIGDIEAIYTPLVIGGGEDGIYRGDSFICQAAIHAGVVSNAKGGCGILHLNGPHSSYPASTAYGIASFGFDSYFPKSYTFTRVTDEECGSVDLRWPLLGVTLTFTIIISLFSSSPAVFFGSTVVMLFFHIGLISDRPNLSSTAALVSLLLGRFLPAACTSYVLYRAAAQPQLAGLTAQVEKTILYLGGAWVGALNNYTFSFIPLQRLTPHDLKQPGAVLSLVAICLLLFTIALGQVYFLRQEGLLRRYLVIYGLMASALLIGVAVPALSLRIHHYILAMLLIPGTRPQTRAGLLYQGLLLGLFLNGTARWGFASVLETPAALRAKGPDGEETWSAVPAVNATVQWTSSLHATVAHTAAAAATAVLRFAWNATALPDGADGVSVVVNDVERHRWYVGEGAPRWEYRRTKGRGKWWSDPADAPARDYFRFAYLDGADALEYGPPGIWLANGTWAGFEGEEEARRRRTSRRENGGAEL